METELNLMHQHAVVNDAKFFLPSDNFEGYSALWEGGLNKGSAPAPYPTREISDSSLTEGNRVITDWVANYAGTYLTPSYVDVSTRLSRQRHLRMILSELSNHASDCGEDLAKRLEEIIPEWEEDFGQPVSIESISQVNGFIKRHFEIAKPLVGIGPNGRIGLTWLGSEGQLFIQFCGDGFVIYASKQLASEDPSRHESFSGVLDQSRLIAVLEAMSLLNLVEGKLSEGRTAARKG